MGPLAGLRVLEFEAIGPGPFGEMARCVAFDPTGRYLATSNWNGTVAILRTPEPPRPDDAGPAPRPPDPKELAAKPADDKMVNALQKSWKKMTPAAREQALLLNFGPKEKSLLERALAATV